MGSEELDESVTPLIKESCGSGQLENRHGQPREASRQGSIAIDPTLKKGLATPQVNSLRGEHLVRVLCCHRCLL